jgi:hypothetical protein
MIMIPALTSMSTHCLHLSDGTACFAAAKIVILFLSTCILVKVTIFVEITTPTINKTSCLNQNLLVMPNCSICQRPVSSYYRTKSHKVYCYDCWKAERERGVRYRDEAMKKYQQEQQQFNILEDRISELESKISSEEHKREELQNQYYIDQLNENLRHTRDEQRRIGTYGPKFPQINDDIMTAKYFESEAAERKYLEEKRKVEAQKKEEERKRAEETERKRSEFERKRKAEETILQQKLAEKESLLKRGGALSRNDRIELAINSGNERVLTILERNTDIQVLEALLKNANISQEMRQRILRKKNRIINNNHEEDRNKRKGRKGNGCATAFTVLLLISSIIAIGYYLLSTH